MGSSLPKGVFLGVSRRDPIQLLTEVQAEGFLWPGVGPRLHGWHNL